MRSKRRPLLPPKVDKGQTKGFHRDHSFLHKATPSLASPKVMQHRILGEAKGERRLSCQIFSLFKTFYGWTPFVWNCTRISPCHASWIICNSLSPISTWWSCHQFTLIGSLHPITATGICITFVSLFSLLAKRETREAKRSMWRLRFLRRYQLSWKKDGPCFILLNFWLPMIPIISYVGFLTLFLIGTLVIYLGLLKIRLIW